MPTPDESNHEVLATPDHPSGDRASVKLSPPLVLKKRKDFVAASKSGHKGVASSIIIQMNPKPFYGPSETADGPILRYGLTASKKTGNAVCRNRAKRRMRAIAVEFLPQHGIAGCDYVMIARHNTAAISHDVLLRDFKYALKKANQRKTDKNKTSGPTSKAKVSKTKTDKVGAGKARGEMS